jgi:hypothetical protein
MRREYLHDLVLVLGGATLIAGAWIVYWQAGLMMAGLVMILLAIVAYRHHGHHQPPDHDARHDSRGNAGQHREDRTPQQVAAAAWRLHHYGRHGSQGSDTSERSHVDRI